MSIKADINKEIIFHTFSFKLEFKCLNDNSLTLISTNNTKETKIFKTMLKFE